MERIREQFNPECIPLDDYGCHIGVCNYTGANASQLLSHFRTMHEKDKEFRSPCLYSKTCAHQEDFHSFRALSSHIRSFHPLFGGKSCSYGDCI